MSSSVERELSARRLPRIIGANEKSDRLKRWEM
jgi:hypothetical protein